MDLTTAVRILGVNRNASLGDAKKAYRRIAKQTHPDVAGPRGAEQFRQATEAIELFEQWAKSGRRTEQESRPENQRASGRAATPGGPRGRQDSRYGAHNAWGDTRHERWRSSDPAYNAAYEDEEPENESTIGHGTPFTILSLKFDGHDVPDIHRCRASLVINRGSHPNDKPSWRISISLASAWQHGVSMIEFVASLPDEPGVTAYYLRPVAGRSYGRNGIESVDFEP